jgi:hypothetical protein
MSDFERLAVQRLIDQATIAGVPVPNEVRVALHHARTDASTGAELWLIAHPDEASWPIEAHMCCVSAAYRGPAACHCWTPVYDLRQAEPRPPTGPADLAVRDGMCGDCAFRKGSPERAEAWTEETLLDLPVKGEPFWCHDGIRRPAYWSHPTLGDVPGTPDDYQPPVVANIPYRADGAPGLLCAGWMARASRARAGGVVSALVDIQPRCCRCTWATCTTEQDGEHCLDVGCAFCVHGCPAGDRPCCREDS